MQKVRKNNLKLNDLEETKEEIPADYEITIKIISAKLQEDPEGIGLSVEMGIVKISDDQEPMNLPQWIKATEYVWKKEDNKEEENFRLDVTANANKKWNDFHRILHTAEMPVTRQVKQRWVVTNTAGDRVIVETHTGYEVNYESQKINDDTYEVTIEKKPAAVKVEGKEVLSGKGSGAVKFKCKKVDNQWKKIND